MALDIIRQLNWVDIFVVIVIIRTSYISLRRGISSELFRLLGNICAIYVSLHYYTGLSDLLSWRFDLEVIPLEFLDFLCFVFLVVAGDLAFLILRQAFSRFFKMEAEARLNKFGGLILGVVRSFLLVGLITFMLLISSVSYFRNSVIDSYSGRRFLKVAPSVYSWLWNKIMSKFMQKEKFNQTILEVQEGI